MQVSDRAGDESQPQLYFWALGDLHIQALGPWQAIANERYALMFQDLRTLWRESAPAFCVSPGDIVDVARPEDYALARGELARALGSVPFYPGIGNHEFFANPFYTKAYPTPLGLANFAEQWGRPARYAWVERGVLCIMLDVIYASTPLLGEETLAFLDESLAAHADLPAILFAHCPLYNTVQDRDAELDLDYDSMDFFFYLENSADIRHLLSRHSNALLFISGHTHSGWGSPNLVHGEQLADGHRLTSLNLMSPWYTGRRKGPVLSPDLTRVRYRPDNPDLLASFAVEVYAHKIVMRLRDHRERRWMARWEVSF